MYDAVSAATSFHPSGPSLGPRRAHAKAVPINVAREARQNASVVVRALLSNLRHRHAVMGLRWGWCQDLVEAEAQIKLTRG